MELWDLPFERPGARDVAADLEVLDKLLNTLTDVLGVREVFDRSLKLGNPSCRMTSCAVEIERTAERFRLYAGSGLPQQRRSLGGVSDREMLQKWDCHDFG